MTTNRDDATHIRTGPESPASGAPAPTSRRCRMFGAAVLGIAALAVLGALAAVGAFNGTPRCYELRGHAEQCSYPDATNTGVPSGMTLKSVPSQVSSGPGWHYNAAGNYVIVTVNGTVLSGLYIPYYLMINASNVTVNDVQVVTGGFYGIGLTHTAASRSRIHHQRPELDYGPRQLCDR